MAVAATVLWGGRENGDFHGLDQAVFDCVAVADVFVGQDGACQVADDEVDVDEDLMVVLGIKSDRLDVRVDLGPLLSPIRSDFVMTSHKASLKCPWPCDVWVHGGKGGVEVPRVEASVSSSEEFDFRGGLFGHGGLGEAVRGKNFHHRGTEDTEIRGEIQTFSFLLCVLRVSVVNPSGITLVGRAQVRGLPSSDLDGIKCEPKVRLGHLLGGGRRDSTLIQNRLGSVGADADDLDGLLHDLGDGVDVGSGSGGQVFELGHAGDVGLPAFDCAVDRLGGCQVFDVRGEILGTLAIDFVGFADLQFGEFAQNIQEHQGDAIDAGDFRTVASRDGIEPATATRTTSDGAEFVPFLADVVAGFIEEFGGAGATADAGRVRLDDANHLRDETLGETRAVVNPGSGAVGTGDVREGAVVEVEQRALGSFEQKRLAFRDGVVKEARGIDDVVFELVGVAHVVVVDLVELERDEIRIESLEHLVFKLQDLGQTLLESRWSEEVTHADGVRASCFFAITGADPAHRGADGVTLLVFLEDCFLSHMVRHDDVSPVGDEQLSRDIDPLTADAVDLFEEGFGVDHDTGGDDGGHTGTKNAGREQGEFVGLAFEFNGVSGVVAPLIADNDLVLVGEKVDDLAFGFVAPLKADNCGNGHG